MIEKTYKCNLCKKHLKDGTSNPPLGIQWDGLGIIHLVPYHTTDNHLCPLCLSSLQATQLVCGSGFYCSGGPKCSSDHK